MIERYPYGKAPFWLTALALVSLILVVVMHRREEDEPDLVLAISAANHVDSYKEVLPRFEAKHGVKVALNLVHSRALQTRLQNAIMAGAEVPDLVELQENHLAFFTRGPVKDVGFTDLTDVLTREGLRERLVESRLSLWMYQGRVFAAPHDVHPVMLMYRADIVEELGIDVSKLETWDDFVEVGRNVVKDLDGDGVPDRYMIDLPVSAAWGLLILLRQRDVSLFDENGNLTFNRPETVDTIIWYARQVAGKDRIAFECGWGQPFYKAMFDGLVLFYIAPDWRSYTTQMDAPGLAGKMKLMPLPAWTKGGRRTSVWGGTGLAITKASERQDLAWELAKELYFQPKELGKRFATTNIIPPLKDAWDLPEFREPNPYFSGQAIGAMYAKLAAETPVSWGSPYYREAEGQLSQVFLRAMERYRTRGESSLREFVQDELDRAEAYLNRVISRNVLAKR